MAAKKPTLFQQAQKEIKRIEKAAKRISQRGYEFKNVPYFREKKRYTRKDVEKLKQVKSKDLYKYSTAFGMSGERYREVERSRAAQKAAETRKGLNRPFEFGTDYEREEMLKYQRSEQARKEREELVSISRTVIDNFLERDNFLRPPKFTDDGYEKVVEYINREINTIGLAAVAQGLENAANLGIVREVHMSYDWTVDTNLDKLNSVMGYDIPVTKIVDDAIDGWMMLPEDEENEIFNEYFK